jgi:hypothetical protein
MHSIDLITKDHLTHLMAGASIPRVSIYMPTARKGTETQQSPIRLRKLLNQAEERLKEQGWRWNEIEAILKPAKDLMDEEHFWLHQADGLAIFLGQGIFHKFRLPIQVEEQAMVADHFHLKPLLPVFANDGVFYILTLAENEVKFFEGTRHSVHEVAVEGMPGSMAEALWADDPEKQQQWHTRAGMNPEGAGRAAMFHGSGDNSGMEVHKTSLKRYFDKVDAPLHKFLHDKTAPLVLAGVDYLLPIYREANKYNNLVPTGVEGNMEHVRSEDFHEKAWKVVEPIFKQNEEQAKARFHELMGTGLAATDLEEVVVAAHHGRVDTLFVALDERVWGTFDPEALTVEITGEQRNGDADLLNLTALQTIATGGTVFAKANGDLPGGNNIAAIYRY